MQFVLEWVPAVLIVALVLTLCVALVVALRRSPYTRPQSFLYFADQLLTRVLWRAKVEGKFDLPRDRGAVIVCNHRSSVDPFFIQLIPWRLVHWMVAAEYFRYPLVGHFLRYMQAIPTRRGGVDTGSTRQAIQYAARGELVGMLPEGRINDTPELLLPGRPGAVFVALKARVSVVPCYIEGAPYDGTVWGCFFMTARVRLVVGPALDLSEYYEREPTAELLGELTLRLLREIARLGGQPDFRPQLAGRKWKPEPGENGV